jgi:predicted transcriptional regulator
MMQLTLRLPDALVARLKQAARARGSSLNGYAGAVLAAAVDPELAGDEMSRLRERLDRAGLLAAVAPPSRPVRRPDPAAVAAARAAAGQGRPLADLVSEDRD